MNEMPGRTSVQKATSVEDLRTMARRRVPRASECAAVFKAGWKGLSLRIGDVVFSAMGQVALHQSHNFHMEDMLAA